MPTLVHADVGLMCACCAGQELLNSKLIREVGLSDGFVIHAAASQKANPAHELASEAALEQQAASPITLLSKQVI